MAKVAPPIEPTPENSAMPESLNDRCGPTACSLIVSPS